MLIDFVVTGEPEPQPRHRVSKFGAYIPKSHKIHPFKESVRLLGMQAMAGKKPFAGCVKITVIAVFSRLQGRPDYILKEEWQAGVRLPYQGSKDWDNIAKSVCDALIQVCYRNDNQIVSGTVEKWMAAVGESAHCRIMVEDAFEG